MAESYLQHAEHYYRILAAAQAQQQQYQMQQQTMNPNGNGGANGGGRPVNGSGEQPYTDGQPNGASFGMAENSGEDSQAADALNEGF